MITARTKTFRERMAAAGRARIPQAPTDVFASLLDLVSEYEKNGLTPSGSPAAFDALSNTITTAYRKGKLSDNEFDNLTSLINR